MTFHSLIRALRVQIGIMPMQWLLLTFLILPSVEDVAANGQRRFTRANSCDDASECKLLTDCPQIADYFNEKFDQIRFCEQSKSIICCPKSTPTVVTEDNQSNIIGSECLAYHKQQHVKCDPVPLIIGGTDANPREFPHMALLGYKNLDNSINWYCGGTLISPKYVISAAHCFYISKILNQVRLGELDYDSETDDAQPQDFAIKHYIIHPRYNWSKRYNDIVIVELDGEATFNSYVAPACLPYSNGTEFDQFIAAGWGSTKFASAKSPSHLQKVRLERFDDTYCNLTIEPSENLEFGLNTRTQLCAGSMTDRRDTCSGDSGGPLFVEHPHLRCMFLLVGIVSFGYACGTPGTPGIYTRVNLYVDWIQRVVWKTAS